STQRDLPIAPDVAHGTASRRRGGLPAPCQRFGVVFSASMRPSAGPPLIVSCCVCDSGRASAASNQAIVRLLCPNRALMHFKHPDRNETAPPRAPTKVTSTSGHFCEKKPPKAS